MSVTAAEIASQPDAWREAARRSKQASTVIPGNRGLVAVTGCGTSFYMAQALAALLEGDGPGRWEAHAASEFPHHREFDDVLVISRSGTTTEAIRVEQALRGRSARTTLVTAVHGSPLEQLAGRTMVIEFADEESVVQTRFPTSLLALARAHLGEDIEPLARAAEAVVGGELPVDPAHFQQWVFLGTGWRVGLAFEAALKMREMSCAWSEAYAAMEYRHGPISLAGRQTVIWPIGEVPADVLNDARQHGATVVPALSDPLLDLVRLQRTALALAEAKGLDVDRPAHLVRSIVLA